MLIFAVGLIGSHSELGSLTFAFNNAFFLRNVTVTVKHVNITEESDLFTEGKTSQRYFSHPISTLCCWFDAYINGLSLLAPYMGFKF